MKFRLVEIGTYFTMGFFLCIDIEMLSILKKYITKVIVNKELFYFELSSKPMLIYMLLQYLSGKNMNLKQYSPIMMS